MVCIIQYLRVYFNRIRYIFQIAKRGCKYYDARCVECDLWSQKTILWKSDIFSHKSKLLKINKIFLMSFFTNMHMNNKTYIEKKWWWPQFNEKQWYRLIILHFQLKLVCTRAFLFLPRILLYDICVMGNVKLSIQ